MPRWRLWLNRSTPKLQARGVDDVMDDRGLRPGAMFADMELVGIPHRVVVSERGWPRAASSTAAGATPSRQLGRDEVLALLAG